MTNYDKYSRVTQMIIDDGDTWDLSPNDKESLRHVLGMVNVMADELASFTGSTVPQVIDRVGKFVEKHDSAIDAI